MGDAGVTSLRPAVARSIAALEDWQARMQEMERYVHVELVQLYELRAQLDDSEKQVLVTTDTAALLVGRLHTIWGDFEGGVDGLKLSVLRKLRDGLESAASAYGTLRCS
jgi:hypothetical protein